MSGWRRVAWTNDRVLMLAATLVIGVASTLWAERVMFGDGFGWDGQLYGASAKDFHRHVVVEGLPRYYVQRLLPAAVVHYGLRLFGAPLGDAQVLLAFDVYQVLLLLLSTLLWSSIADGLRIRRPGRWFGFSGLFLSFATLKNTFYNPVQTDVTAFALGLLMLHAFLADSRSGLLAVMVLGSFTWPTVPYMAALLYVFPRQPAMAPPGPPTMARATRLAALASGGALVVYLVLTGQRFAERMVTFSWGVRIDTVLVPVSVAAIVIYLFLALRPAVADDRLLALRRGLAAIRWPRLLVAGATLLVLEAGVRALAGGRELPWGSPRWFAVYTLMASLTEPLIFLLAHVVYYGPAVILLVLLWRPFCEVAGELGLGFRLFVVANVLLSLNPQSRYQINAIGAFVVVLVRLLDRRGLGYRGVVVWALLSVVYSKVWYPFNTAPQLYDGTMKVLLEFPLQHYYMNAGPWMSHEMYLVQGAVVLATAAGLSVALGRGMFGARPRLDVTAVDPSLTDAARRPIR